MPDVISLAAAAGTDGGLGKIGTVPIAGVLYVRCPVNPNTERIDWLIDNDKAITYQLYKQDKIVQTVVGTNAGGNNADTIVANGVTLTAETNTTVYASNQFAIDGTPTVEAVLIARLLNHGYVFTLTDVAVGDYIIVDGVKFTAAAAAALNATRCFSQAGTDAQDATSLAASINDLSYGVPNVIAVANGTEVIVRNRPGVAHEKPQIVASTGQASIALVENGVPGIVATSAAAVVTVVPKLKGGAYTIQIVGNARFVITTTTLANLIRVGGVVSAAADSTTKEFSVEQYVDGWIPYIGISNADGAAALTPTVRACRYQYRV